MNINVLEGTTSFVTNRADFISRLGKLETSVCLDKVKDRLKHLHLWSDEEAEEAKIDFIRFAGLAQLTQKELVPTKRIDEFWHTFLIYTKMYKEWCELNWGEDWFFHHQPGHKGDGSWEFTKNLAKQVYGVTWEESAMADSCGCSIPNPRPAAVSN